MAKNHSLIFIFTALNYSFISLHTKLRMTPRTPFGPPPIKPHYNTPPANFVA